MKYDLWLDAIMLFVLILSLFFNWVQYSVIKISKKWSENYLTIIKNLMHSSPDIKLIVARELLKTIFTPSDYER